ncbi:MAG: GNAT family N-acetyltransferase [Bacteroidota bacterium]
MGEIEVSVREGSLDEVIQIASRIPEFIDPYSKQEYEQQLKGRNFLILIAAVKDELAGFKLGYDLGDDFFYSWFGGVPPDLRQHGIAKLLAQHQESWAKNNGFKRIRIKTRNSFTPMLLFTIKSGFNIIDLERKSDVSEHRILLEKELG